MAADPRSGITPEEIFDSLVAYQRSGALKAAIALDLFSAIADGQDTVETLAERCESSPRGIRSLCHYLVAAGFLGKEGDRFVLDPGTARHLVRGSEAYIGSIAGFLNSRHLTDPFMDVEAAVRQGGTVQAGGGVTGPGHGAWVDFARAMRPMAGRVARLVADRLRGRLHSGARILDVAAGHGLYGATLAGDLSESFVTFLDWGNVLEVAEETARREGLEGRFELRPGDAMEIDLGGPYDLVLLPNFLHHYGPSDCLRFLKRVRGAVKAGGMVATIESLVNEDRISPPSPASFSLVMLVMTPEGDSFTETDLERLFREAGFTRNESTPLPEVPQHLYISRP